MGYIGIPLIRERVRTNELASRAVPTNLCIIKMRRAVRKVYALPFPEPAEGRVLPAYQ